MMKGAVLILGALLLTACGGNLRTAEIVQYDFGNLSGKNTPATVPIAAVDVQAASWLSGGAMHYRLAYAEPLRRQLYAESRWVAPPAELLETYLKRRVIFGQPDSRGAGCRIHLALDELEQRFDAPASSQAVLDVRAVLLPSRGAETLSRRSIHIEKAAAAPLAREGVAAAREAVEALAGALDAWLGEVARDQPSVVERCRS